MSNNDTPYEILGIADDGQAYFIDQSGRLQHWLLTTLNKSKLLVLAPLEFWAFDSPKINWDEKINEVIMLSGKKEFDPDKVKGRGAWRNKEGGICYFDGNAKNLLGDPNPNWVFTKRVQKDIGIGYGDDPGHDVRDEIYELNKLLPYSTKFEAAKLLAWATLAPFCGALEWRPACFVTAQSGAGKTSVIDLIVTPLAIPLRASGGGSTEPGIRQRVVKDAVPIFVEELEDDTKKKRENKEAILSLMRQSTSDDAPEVLKGTSDGGGTSYALKCMFLFAGISPDVTNEADENRIVWINLTPKKKLDLKRWNEVQGRLKELLSEDNCKGIRALTFQNLEFIFATAKRIQPLIQEITGESERFAIIESLLISALLIVWLDKVKDDEIDKWVRKFYVDYEKQQRKSDSDDLMAKLLDKPFKVYEETMKGTFTVRSLLFYLKSGKMPKIDQLGYEAERDLESFDRGTLERLLKVKGFGINNSEKHPEYKGHVMFFKNSQWIKDNTQIHSYYELLKRHDDFLGETTASMVGKTVSCVVVGGILE